MRKHASCDIWPAPAETSDTASGQWPDRKTAPAATKWLLGEKTSEAVQGSAFKLFCLPQAGMGAWVYQSWSERLAPHIQVMPVELPGHGSRLKEPRLTDLCQLSISAVDALEPFLRQGNYAIFGHSMGAWIAWEMLLEITRRGLPLPVRLFVSGNRAACLHGAQHDVDPVLMHTLPPEQFWPHFRHRYGENKNLEDPAMQAFMYPMLRDDFQVVETYQPSNPAAKTTVPTVAIGGALDKRYTREQVKAWSEHTTSRLTEVWLDNQGHNYIAECPHGLIAMLRMELNPFAQPPRGRVTNKQATAAGSADDGQDVRIKAADADQDHTAADQRPAPLWRRICCCA